MEQSPMTRAEFDTLPLSLDLNVANRALGMGRTLGYGLAKAGNYPCRVLRVGNRYRVMKADLERALGMDSSVAAAA